MSFSKSAFSLALFSAMPVMLAAGNLLFNSSFELGEGGWSAFREDPPGLNEFHDVAPSWKVDDKDAHMGRSSFLMWTDSPELSMVVLSSHDFLVKPDKSYTVSFWAKASKPGASLRHSVYSGQRVVRRDAAGNPLPDIDFKNCGKDTKNYRGQGGMKLSTEWARYSYSFTPEKGITAYALWFGIGKLFTEWKPVSFQPDMVSVRLDCVQVEEGPLTDYAPKADVEAAVSTSDYLYEDSGSVTGAVKAISYDQDRQLALPITLYDTFFERKIQEKTLNFALKKGIVSEAPIAFDSVPYGMFCIYTGLQPRTTPPGFHAKWEEQQECLTYERLRYGDESYQSAAYFAMVCKNSPYVKTGFRMGTTGPLDNFVVWRATTALGSVEEIGRLLRLSGGNVLRCWDPSLCIWSRISPEKGVFLWDEDDKRVAAAEKAGVKTLCCIGGMFFSKNKDRDFVPEWARRRDRSGNPEGSLLAKARWGGHKDDRYYLPQLEDWREYISAVATHYKGRIPYYEILNESDLYMPAESYMEYMKAAAEEIRKADPDAVILGICATSDLSADLNANYDTYISKCLSLGADSYMDYITFHPYAMLDNSYPVSQQESRRKVLANLKSGNVKAGLWTGEDYYLIPSWNPMTDFGGRWEPENIARFLVVDMGEGLAGSVPTHYPQSLLSSQLHPFMNGDMTRDRLRGYPNARFAVHSATARFIAGAEPLRKYDLPTGALAYTFRNHGKLYSAVWNACAKFQTYLILSKQPARIYDVMGNQVKLDVRELELSAKPYYLEWDCGEGELAKIFEEAILKGKENFDLLGIRVFQGERTKAIVSFRNTSGKLLEDATLKVSSDSLEKPVSIKLAKSQPMAVESVEVPLKLKGSPGSVELKLEFNNHIDQTTAPVERLLPVFTYEGAPQPIAKIVNGKVASPEDLSASFTASYNKGDLLLNVKVKDDKRGQRMPNPWEEDNIELFIDAYPFQGDGIGYQRTTYQLHVSPWREGKDQVSKGKFPCAVSATVKELPDGYEASIRIALGSLKGISPLAGKMIGFDIAIDDSDSNARKSMAVWHGTTLNHQDRNHFGVLQFMPDATRK